MKKDGYYSSGEFAKMADVTLRTIRYYDKQNLLKPSYVNEHGARFYTDSDFVKLQQILLFKFLGFSLSEIRDMTLNHPDRHVLLDSLDIQLKLVKDRREQLQLMEQTIQTTADTIRQKKEVDWKQMMDLIHMTSMEKSLKNQYMDASNINARIHLHELYSTNKKGWFPWIFEQCHIKNDMNILEIGCGDGTFWTTNEDKLPRRLSVTLTDISEGMLRDARRNLKSCSNRDFTYVVADAAHLPFADSQFDLVLANHVLFYLDNPMDALKEIKRVLNPNGVLIASTYGEHHMEEVTSLARGFDERITLSADNLYLHFGKENGKKQLQKYFSDVSWLQYDDSLYVTDYEPVVEYVLSCHGNQNRFIVDRYKEFVAFVKEKTDKGLKITKDAGVFIAKK